VDVGSAHAECVRPWRVGRRAVALTWLLLAAMPGFETAAQEPLDRPSTSRLVELSLAAKERERLKELASRARARLAVLTREAERLASSERSVLQELRGLELAQQRHALEEAAALASGRVAAAEAAETAERIRTLEAAAAARLPAVRARARRLYQLGPLDAPRYWIRPEGLTDTARAWRLLAAVSARDRALLTDAARERDELARLHHAQRQRAEDAQRLATTAANAKAAAAQATRAREVLLSRLSQERALATRLVAELREADTQLETLLAVPVGTSPTPGDQVPSLPLGAFKGALAWPASGPVVAHFGRARQSRFGTVLPRNGIEIAATDASPVQSVHDGRVAFADQFAGYGRLVIVDHGRGVFSLYGHLGSLDVGRGAPVTRGMRLGSVGPTPAGAHALYFELRIDGKPVNPLEWLASPAARRSRP
jgi:murein DD-endopeptidase MepM/ murein hydrolase activator NlpD